MPAESHDAAPERLEKSRLILERIEAVNERAAGQTSAVPRPRVDAKQRRLLEPEAANAGAGAVDATSHAQFFGKQDDVALEPSLPAGKVDHASRRIADHGT